MGTAIPREERQRHPIAVRHSRDQAEILPHGGRRSTHVGGADLPAHTMCFCSLEVVFKSGIKSLGPQIEGRVHVAGVPSVAVNVNFRGFTKRASLLLVFLPLGCGISTLAAEELAAASALERYVL